jgi:hypothetical protein
VHGGNRWILRSTRWSAPVRFVFFRSMRLGLPRPGCGCRSAWIICSLGNKLMVVDLTRLGRSTSAPKWWEVLRGEAKATNAGPKSASSVAEDLHAVAMEVTRRVAPTESQEVSDERRPKLRPACKMVKRTLSSIPEIVPPAAFPEDAGRELSRQCPYDDARNSQRRTNRARRLALRPNRTPRGGPHRARRAGARQRCSLGRRG